jgi:hypothetical protein
VDSGSELLRVRREMIAVDRLHRVALKDGDFRLASEHLGEHIRLSKLMSRLERSARQRQLLDEILPRPTVDGLLRSLINHIHELERRVEELELKSE